MAPRLWKIELLVETDDEDEVERLGDEIARLACDEPLSAEHSCRLPWFLITCDLDEADAEAWRNELNR